MSIDQKIEVLRKMGFTIGERDPNFNRAFVGKYMVIEPHEKSEGPTDDGRNGPWCIVGDSLVALVEEAFNCYEGNIMVVLYDCEICGGLHPWDWNGDCRDNANRYADPEDYAERNKKIDVRTIEVRSMDERVEADNPKLYAAFKKKG